MDPYPRGSEEWLRHIAINLHRQLLGIELHNQKGVLEPAVVAFIVPIEWGRLTYPVEIEGLTGYYGVRVWVRGNHRTVMAVQFCFYPPLLPPSAELLEKIGSEFGLTVRAAEPVSNIYGLYSPNL